MSLVAAVAPHTTARACQHSTAHATRGSCSLCPHASLSAGFTQNCQQDSSTKSSASTGQVHKTTPQYFSTRVFFQHSSETTCTVRVQLPQSCWRAKTNTSILVTNMQLLNVIALWFSSKAGGKATLLQREQDRNMRGCTEEQFINSPPYSAKSIQHILPLLSSSGNVKKTQTAKPHQKNPHKTSSTLRFSIQKYTQFCLKYGHEAAYSSPPPSHRQQLHAHTHAPRPPLFFSPFRVMTIWAIPAACIVSHICGKDVISQAHQDFRLCVRPSSLCTFLQVHRATFPKAIICVQQCFLFLRAVLSY